MNDGAAHFCDVPPGRALLCCSKRCKTLALPCLLVVSSWARFLRSRFSTRSFAHVDRDLLDSSATDMPPTDSGRQQALLT